MTSTTATGAPAPAFTDADLLKALRYVTDLFEAEEMPSNARKCRAAADRLEEVSSEEGRE